MHSIEVSIGGQKYLVKGEEKEAHLEEVAEVVRRKVEALRKQTPNLSLQKAAMLAALDFASEIIKGRKRALDYRTEVLAKADQLLERVERELSSPTSF